MPIQEKGEVVFVHSLWRAGSTYIFNKFRHADGYFAYQEPLHEKVLTAAGHLGQIVGLQSDAYGELRHPDMAWGHFYEMAVTHDAWKDAVAKDLIYDRYFNEEADPRLAAFFQALIDAASGRPVIQECRTSLRIGGLREALGGKHVVLLRNPRDQWWSFKINPYFDAVIQLLRQADAAPQSIRQLNLSNGFVAFHAGEIDEEIGHFMRHPCDAKESYRIFFALWCFAARHAQRHADLVIMVDLVNREKGYRTQVEESLARLGIDGISLDDCDLFMSAIPPATESWFADIERSLLNELPIDGLDDAEIQNIVATLAKFEAVRQQHIAKPANCPLDISLARSQLLAIEQLDRRHELARQIREWAARERAWYEQQAEFRLSDNDTAIAAGHAEIEALTQRAHRAEARLAECDNAIAAAHAEIETLTQRAHHAEASLAERDTAIAAAHAEIETITDMIGTLSGLRENMSPAMRKMG